MKEVETLSKNSVRYLHEYYSDKENVKVDIKLREETVPSYRPPKFVKVRRGSYVDEEGNVHSRSDVWIKVSEEDYGTDFSLR